ncbi:uncharacterized protein RAG0_03357 [Rhynchosporium agropyri]|uniref:Uncharacterized protein n=1 Tax=Rhynchosporium agropyri TaxID=914238 RepID=A0A1E1K416_9HELO|nr:uncharacterized protein RAG0_03357 [Rhynchosporium agropyri]
MPGRNARTRLANPVIASSDAYKTELRRAGEAMMGIGITDSPLAKDNEYIGVRGLSPISEASDFEDVDKGAPVVKSQQNFTNLVVLPGFEELTFQYKDENRGGLKQEVKQEEGRKSGQENGDQIKDEQGDDHADEYQRVAYDEDEHLYFPGLDYDEDEEGKDDNGEVHRTRYRQPLLSQSQYCMDPNQQLYFEAIDDEEDE